MVRHFELQLAECGTSAGKIDLDASVWIDGEFLDQPFYINLPDLIHSIHVPGDYEIFVCGCGCGSAGCAGAALVCVSHEGGTVRWKWKLPVFGTEPDPDDARPRVIPVEFVFYRCQMLTAMTSFVAAAGHLIGTQAEKYDWPVFGFTARDLVALDPSKPYYTARFVRPQ